MPLESMIAELSAMNGPSGSEGAVAHRLAQLMAPYTQETYTDALGNVVGVKRCGRPNAKKLLICAHIDEIGLIVTGYSEGFLQISNIGGLDARMLPAHCVDVLTEPPMFGVIGCMPVHALSADEMNKATKIEDLFIDVGLTDAEARARIPLGTPVVIHDSCVKLGADSLSGKAMDNRACAAIMIEALELVKDDTLDVDIFAMGSVQEELGRRGAGTGAFGVAPDLAVVLDVTHAKTPDYRKWRAFEPGSGACVGVGPVMARALSDRLIALAKEKGIPYTVEASGGDPGTDVWAVQISRAGVPTALISTPVKYMHTPVETLRLSDARASAQLLAEFLRTVKGGDGLC